MYIIKQSGVFIGSLYHAESEISYGLSSNYIQFSKAKCKKIARTFYFYITEHIHPNLLLLQRALLDSSNFYRLFQREVHGD